MDKKILLLNYWEHFNREKELARLYPPDAPQRQVIQEAMNDIQNKLNDGQ